MVAYAYDGYAPYYGPAYGPGYAYDGGPYWHRHYWHRYYRQAICLLKKERPRSRAFLVLVLLSGAESGVPERGCEIFVAFASEFFLGRPEPRHMRRNLVAFAREPVIFFFFAHCHLC